MQLSVKLYQAISVDRGANLDTIDMPLNNRLWIKSQTDLNAIVNRTDPGPGGFYDDLGTWSGQLRLVRNSGTYIGFSYNAAWPVAWWNHAASLYEAPLQIRYTSLDPEARYRLRVVYAGDSQRAKIKLAAGDPAIEVHPMIDKPSPMRPLEFDIPAAATAGGELLLTWRGEEGLGGNGRGTTVAEVWLLRRQ